MKLSILSAVMALLGAAIIQPARADVDIATLIDEAGLRDGPVAMRDAPRWREPQKIVFWGRGRFDLNLGENASDVELVNVSSQAEMLSAAPGADAIIGACDAEVIAAAPDALWVQQYASGAERCLSVPDVASGRVVMTNMQKMASPAIGEHAVAMTLALGRGLGQYAKTMSDGAWQSRSISASTVEGQVMLVAGLGGIGRETAKRAAALGMTVYATRNSSRNGPDYVEYVGLSHELLELAAKADVIVNALPLTAATTGLYDKAFFDAVKPGALFINVARGRSVVTNDLVAALESGQIAGAGLDVTEPEPLPAEHPLWQMPNVIITPHIAWQGSNPERHQAVLQENLRRFLAGDALLNVVDPTRGY